MYMLNNTSNQQNCFPKFRMLPTYQNFANQWHMSQHAAKSGFVAKASKTGEKLTALLYRTPKTVTILKLNQKTSSREFTVQSLLYAAQAQKQIN